MGQPTGQRWDLAYPKHTPVVASPEGHALAKKLRMSGRVDIAVAPDRKEGRHASCSCGDLTIALVNVAGSEGEEHLLTITHRASGFAVREAVARPGVYRAYDLPATAAALKAGVAACRALEGAAASLGAAWGEDHPYPEVLKLEGDARREAGRRIGDMLAAVAFPHLEAVLDAQDRRDIAARRKKLMDQDREKVMAQAAEAMRNGWRKREATKRGVSRGHAGWVDLVVRGEFWWQAGKLWAATPAEVAERDRRLDGRL